MFFGILHRYVMGEVIRAFLMALTTMTTVLMLFMVMTEALKMGLGPHDILTLIPFVIPSTLAYTVPVSMLFAVTVVFGRLASDNEVIAVKTAGLSAMTILWPAIFMGAALSASLLYLNNDFIPRCNTNAKLAIFKNFEDAFYKYLKIDKGFTNPEWPFLIFVLDVDLDTHTMHDAIFKHRAKKDSGQDYDMVVRAKKANIKFDMIAGVARVYLDGSEIVPGGKSDDVVIINDRVIEMPIPDKNAKAYEKGTMEFTRAELDSEQNDLIRKISRERKRQAMAAALWIGSGRSDRVDWVHVQRAFADYGFWEKRHAEIETEKQRRIAQSFGTVLFVILGAPVGILFAKRDFLSAFISCFIPIIICYYPLMLLGMNLGKEGVVPPIIALWGGNLLLVVLAAFVLPHIRRH